MDTTKPSRRVTSATKERTFLANAAHELRTPLHSANGFVEMVLDGFAGPLNERQQEMLGLARTAIGQLGALLEEILFLARVDSGELAPHLTTVNPSTILKRALDSVREPLRENNIALTQTMTGLPTSIRADNDRVREGLAGMLRAAIALMPSGGAMTVAATAQDELLCFEVTLNNVQLTAPDLSHLFDRFYQPHPVDAKRAAHPGLGLVVAKITAEWHGGSAYATSASDGSLILHYALPIGGS